MAYTPETNEQKAKHGPLCAEFARLYEDRVECGCKNCRIWRTHHRIESTAPEPDYDIVGIVKLRNQFGTKWADQVLRKMGAIKPAPRKRRQPRRFFVLKPLPHIDVFTAEMRRQFTTTLEELVDDAWCAIEEVRDEMVEWRDNMEMGGMEHLDKFDDVQMAADAMENCDQPEIPEVLSDIKVHHVPSHYEPRQYPGRGSRVWDALQIFESVEHRLDDLKGRIEAAIENDDITSEKAIERAEELIEAIDELIDSMQSVRDEAEQVEFPGMF